MRSFFCLFAALVLVVGGCMFIGPGSGNQNTNGNANDNTGGNANANADANANSNANDNGAAADADLAGTWTTDGQVVATGSTVVVAIHFNNDNELIEFSIPRSANGTFDEAETDVDGPNVVLRFQGAGGPTFLGAVAQSGERMNGILSTAVALGDSGVIIPAGVTAFTRETGGTTLVQLAPITFMGDVAQEEDPVTFDIGGGSIEFSNGAAMTLGVPQLYSSDFLSWVVTLGPGVIEFLDLDVRVVSFYFADAGAPGGTLTAFNSAGEVIVTINSFTATFFGDPEAQFTIDGGGATIASLLIVTDAVATVALDDLTLTVAE